MYKLVFTCDGYFRAGGVAINTDIFIIPKIEVHEE